MRSRAETFMDKLTAVARDLPRRPEDERKVLRLLSQHTDEPGDVLVFLTALREVGSRKDA